MGKDRDPFEYRIVPRNNWELIRWAVMDGERVNRYVTHLGLTWWQERLLFLRVFCLNLLPFVMGLAILLWLVGITIIAVADPTYLTATDLGGVNINTGWQQGATLGDRWLYLFKEWVAGLLFSLVSSSLFGLTIGLGFGLTIGLGLGLVFCLGLGLTFGMGFGSGFTLMSFLALNLALNFIFSFLAGMILGLVVSLRFYFLISLFLGLLSGLPLSEFSNTILYGFNKTTLLGFKNTTIYEPSLLSLLGFLGGNVMIYLRHLTWGHYRLSLTNNIYLRWENVYTSLFLEQKLVWHTQVQPTTGQRFADFLWQYRPSQHNLAALLAHAAKAKFWENAAINLDVEWLAFPEYDQKGFQVSPRWREQLAAAKKSLIAAETTHLIGARVALFQEFLGALEALHKSTQQVPDKTWRDKISMTRRINWYPYYEAAVAAWLRVGREKYAELQNLAALTEPIATNRYQTGGALSPAYNEAVFMSRDDLREQLSALLYTTQNFSVFFLQGQRRVGKTSLLKFLPHILGRRFELVYFDLQGSIRSVPDFLEKWQRAFVAHFALKDVKPLPTADTWAGTFEALHPLFSATSRERDVKIILALDEYEELHTHLAKDPEQGAAFLGAIRHFSQHQAQVSLMWVGMRFFSELESPNWNEYFPQSVPIQVGYLNRAKTFQLIEVSTLDFEDGIKDRIFDLTQGHPSLIQKICYELVQIANQQGRRLLTHADLDAALRTMVYIRDNGVTDIFWSQNCELPIDKAIVRAIVEGEPLPSKSRQRLRRLIEYGFVVEDGGGYRLRVPIFEEWVRLFGVE